MKRDFLVILWLGMRGNFFFEGQFFFKMFSGVLDRIWCQRESLATELFVADYIS